MQHREQLPLPIDFLFAAQTEAVQSQRFSNVSEHRLNGAEGKKGDALKELILRSSGDTSLNSFRF